MRACTAHQCQHEWKDEMPSWRETGKANGSRGQASPIPEPAGECWYERALCGVSLDGRLFSHRQVKSLGLTW